MPSSVSSCSRFNTKYNYHKTLYSIYKSFLQFFQLRYTNELISMEGQYQLFLSCLFLLSFVMKWRKIDSLYRIMMILDIYSLYIYCIKHRIEWIPSWYRNEILNSVFPESHKIGRLMTTSYIQKYCIRFTPEFITKSFMSYTQNYDRFLFC